MIHQFHRRFFVLGTKVTEAMTDSRSRFLDKPLHVQTYHTECKQVCDDLPSHDDVPVCMMFSRYKRGYQYFVNLCHARRTICKENLCEYLNIIILCIFRQLDIIIWLYLHICSNIRFFQVLILKSVQNLFGRP